MAWPITLVCKRILVHAICVVLALFKKTEGLELGAVDKLLVGILVGCEGEGENLISLLPNHPIYSVIISNNII
jgi:hypothetical protein